MAGNENPTTDTVSGNNGSQRTNKVIKKLKPSAGEKIFWDGEMISLNDIRRFAIKPE